MKVAVMQPYFLPYLGYFQLLHACDRFVVLDDVTFIKQGWINRNRILLHGREHLITMPLSGASSNRLISQVRMHPDGMWRDKLRKQLRAGYGRAPCFETVYPLIDRILNSQETSLSRFLTWQLQEIAAFIGLTPDFVTSSDIQKPVGIKGEARILFLCRHLGATHYINLPGGRHLYDRQRFAEAGIQLQFVDPHLTAYPQPAPTFVPGLSILDVLMHNTVDRVQKMLADYQLT